MSKDYAQIADEVVTGVGLLWQGAPDTAKAFGSLSTAATVTKVLDTKTKELMALAIGIAVHCEGSLLTTPSWPISTEPPAKRSSSAGEPFLCLVVVD